MMKLCRLIITCLCLIAGFQAEAQLNANFSASSVSGCTPMVVQFTDLSTGNPTSYSWNFGNGNNSTLQNPSATYTVAGSYTVTLTISNGTATSTKTLTIIAYSSPTVNFVTADTAGCPPHTVQLASQSTLNAPGAGIYVWDFGNGITGTGQNPTYTYNTPGYYNITHVVINSANCTTSVTKPAYVHVFTPPAANFTANNTLFCGTPANVSFTNLTGGVAPFSCQWEFGDGGTAAVPNPTHAYNALGSYSVKLIVTDGNGCKDTIIKPNYITVTSDTASFTAPLSACEDTWLTFTNTTPFTLYSNWDFGDGTGDTNQVAYHMYTTPGTYTVSLAVNNGTCFPFKAQTIVIHPKPSIAFSANTLTPCPAPATIQFTNNTLNGGTYTWYFGDGTSSNLANPSHTYLANGFYNVTLVSTNSFGCSDSLFLQQYVKIFPTILTINAVPGDGCIPLTDTFSANLISFNPVTGSNTPYPATIASYSWNFGDGFTSTAASPVHTYPNVGTYTVTLHIVTSNGCVDSASVVIHSGTSPVPNFSASPLSVCVDQQVLFTNYSSNATGYIWDFGDGTSSAASNPSKSYSNPGTYTVTLVAINNGCKDTLIKTNYIVVNDPKADFVTSYHCDTLTKVDFINTSINQTSSLWFFGDGTTSTVASPSHVYPAISSYTATLVAYNSTTGCTDTSFTTIDLFDPQPAFTANDTTICPTNTINFTASFPGMNHVIRYDWKIDGALIADTTSVIPVTFNTPGYHTITLLIKDAHNCWDSITRSNYILVGHPQVNFSANNTQVCNPATVIFTSTSVLVTGTSAASLQWDFGNGGSTAGPTGTATTTYNAAGLYDVKLVVTDNIGCKDSLTKYQYINVHDPQAQFLINNTNACVGAPVSFFDQSQGVQLTYAWDFGDGNTSSAPVPSHVYTQTGTYTVSLIITDNAGCKDTIVKPNYITIWGNPSASFTLSDTFKICPPLYVQCTNTSSGQIVNNWDFGDGAASTALNPIHIYVNPGNYTLRLIAINNHGCRDTATANVKLLGYNGAFSYAPLTGCAPLTVSFTANVTNVPGLVWDFADGNTLATTTGTVTHTYLNPGPVVPKLIMTDNAGCSASSNGLDTIKVDGIYSGFTYTPYPACDFGTLQFLDTSRGAFSFVTRRLWTFHDGQTDTTKTPSHFYPAPGDYIVRLYTATSTGCLDTLIDTLRFYPLPLIDAGPDTTICLGDSATLLPNGGVSYTWTPGGTLSCVNCANPFAFPVVPTLYLATGTDIHGCKNTDTVRVNIKTKTVSTVGQGGEICEGESFQLNASGASQYNWLPPTSLDNSHIPNPIASPGGTITYMVIASEGSCIPDTNLVTVVVHPRPSVDAGPDQTIIAGEVADLHATGSLISSLAWTPSESLSCDDCSAPQATPKKTTTYLITVTSEFGCVDSDQVTIFVICDHSQVYMPNSFTPNGDGQNDKFYPRGKGLEIIRSFRIYNRWGELIFERRELNANDMGNAWDGTYKGQLLNPDVFVYMIDAVCDTGEPVSWQGDIALIR